MSQYEAAATITKIPDGQWRVDQTRSEVGFAVRIMWGLAKVQGKFDITAGTLRADANDIDGELTIDAASINTKNDKRDTHLRSADFFDVENYPTIKFTVRSISQAGSSLVLDGSMLIGPKTLQPKIPVRVERLASGALRLRGEVSIARADAGLGWNRAGMVRGDARLHADLHLEPS